MINSANTQKMKDTYLTILNSYGDIVELEYQFDVPSIIDELKSIDKWINGANNKKGLTLTGNEDDLELPAEEFSSVITIPTSDFAKYCRDMIAIANKMELKSIEQFNHTRFLEQKESAQVKDSKENAELDAPLETNQPEQSREPLKQKPMPPENTDDLDSFTAPPMI